VENRTGVDIQDRWVYWNRSGKGEVNFGKLYRNSILITVDEC